MTASVTLSWQDPESAADFAHLAADLRRDGWLPDPSRDELLRLVGTSGVVVLDDGGEEDGREEEPRAVGRAWCNRCRHMARSIPCPSCDGPACGNCGRCPACDGPIGEDGSDDD